MSANPVFQITRKNDNTLEIKFDKIDEIDPVEVVHFVTNLIELREKIEPVSDLSKMFDKLLVNEIELWLIKLLIWYDRQLDKPSKG